jgi:glycosyltransferase involved in cell wall biosynthesis
VEVVHTSAAAPFSPARGGGGARRVLTLYDLAYLRFPGLYGPEYRATLQAALDSLRPGDHVLTTSHFVREELAEAGVAAPDRIHVVYLAADRALFHPCADPQRIGEVRRRYRIPEGPYLLGVNTPDRRKNVPHTIHAFARACREAPGAMGSLVLAGHAGPGSDAVERAVAGHPELAGRIRVTGFVADADLAPLYSGAQQFVYAPLYEGFGLPPLEAMQCGTAVLTSRVASLPEVVGEGGMLVEPDDLEALAGAMVTLASDAARRGRLQASALAQASRFSWERSTADTLAAYRRALGR